MNVVTMRLGAYQTNCYMVWGGEDTCVLIDPGYDASAVLEQVKSRGKQVAAILLTHGHFDHVGGVKEIAAETGCPVYICQKELTLPEGLTAGKLYYTKGYEDGDVVEAAGLAFTVMHTPGHTPGGVCLLCGEAMFSGDTLFAGTIGRTDLPGSDFSAMEKSLDRLAALETDYRVFPGHGASTTLFREKNSNPYLMRK